MEQNNKLIYLATVFVGCLVTANLIAGKMVDIAGFVVPAAVLAYAITFPITDVITEVWGKKVARQVVLAGFVASVVMVVLVYLAVIAPAAGFWEGQAAFETVLGMVPRIVMASMAAYLVSQMHDVWAFSWWKKKLKGKHLWLRNNASTIVSQLIDSTLFITIAFYGVMPEIVPLIAAQFTAKLVIALIDTPVVYALVAWAKK